MGRKKYVQFGGIFFVAGKRYCNSTFVVNTVFNGDASEVPVPSMRFYSFLDSALNFCVDEPF